MSIRLLDPLLAEADRLLKRIEAEPDPLLRRELEALYEDR